MKKIFTLYFLIFALSFNALAQTYIWTPGSTDWQLATNWTPNRTVLLTSDVLLFNNGVTNTVTNIPTQTVGQLLVGNNTTVNLQGAVAGTILTIGGFLLSGHDLEVAAGSTLNINGANATTITLSTGATGNITGNMAFSTSLHRLDAFDGNAINFNSPSVFSQNTGCTGNVFTATGTFNSIVFNTGTTFVQNTGANPFGYAAPNSKVTFNSGSLFRMQQNAAPSFSGRTYANYEVNFATFNQSTTGANALTMDNLTITLGTLNINLTTGGVNVKGNISVAAGQTLTFNPAAASTLTFNGTAAQSITNAGTLTFGANEAVTLNNAAGLTINNNITLNNILTFTSGKLTIGNNTLTISNNAPAAIAGYNVNSYVVTNGTGTLQRAIATATNSYDFPVGNADFYKLCSITYTTAPVAGFLSARWNVGYAGWFNGGPLVELDGGAPDINLNTVAYNGSWFIDPDINLTGGIYTGTFTGNGDNVVINYLQTVLVKRPTTPPMQPWVLDGTHVTTTGSNALHILQRTGMSGFSEFAIAGELNVALSVKLNYLNGFKQNGSHNLVWKVTCTNNPNVTMSLERSADNRTFTGITTITADALRCEQPFNFTDNSPLKGTNYYRLKMIDANGKISYSAAIALLNAASGFDIVGLLPTLVNNNAVLNVTAAQKTKMDVLVTDITGKQVQKIGYNLIAGSNQFSMNLSGLAAGTYQITGYTAEGKSKTIRFVKQ
ncbi:hypothetical protein [Ferruginibacter sp.]|nr:T9SS type A sorting domain-containing protein [Ferruginibacter sp.]